VNSKFNAEIHSKHFNLSAESSFCQWRYSLLVKLDFFIYYPDQQIHIIYIYIYINNIFYIVSTTTGFNASASSSESLKLLLWKSYKIRSDYKLNKRFPEDDADALTHVGVLNDIQNIINVCTYVVRLLVWIINCSRYTVRTSRLIFHIRYHSIHLS